MQNFTFYLNSPRYFKKQSRVNKTNEDLRIKAMLSWLENDLQLTITTFAPASSDASFRRYFRITHQLGQQIVMDAPPELENIRSFITVANLFAGSNVNVPKIYQQNLKQGFLLLEDFGSHCLLDKLDAASASILYQTALECLYKLQVNTDIKNCCLPLYDQHLLDRELTIFDEWYIEKHLNIPTSDANQAIFDETRTILIASALDQPKVCVHRDYHSRNLMLLTDNSPGVIDFQDAVIGPITYDLVSLLRDCYITWPQTQVMQWMKNYYQRLLQAGLLTCDFEQFKRWFDLMGMQRHLKAIGIFARLNLRDNKPDYLKDIPRTMNYVVQITSQYPELSAFDNFLRKQVLPLTSPSL